MFRLEVIPHKDTDSATLDEIINIKSKSWRYAYEEHKRWICKNIKDKDYHLLLKKDEVIVAYMNLIDTVVTINGHKELIYGVGNVCAVEKGKGYGKELMIQTNDFIKETNRIGLLFCKENLVAFYSFFKWQVIDNDKLNIAFLDNKTYTMIFNYFNEIDSLIYQEIAF